MGRKKGPRSAAERLTRTLIQMFFLILLGKSGSARNSRLFRSKTPSMRHRCSMARISHTAEYRSTSQSATGREARSPAFTSGTSLSSTTAKLPISLRFEPPDAHPDIFTVILVIVGVDMSPDELSDADRVALEFREERCPGNLR